MISFSFDQLPPAGDVCTVCKLPIEGIVYRPYIQVGDPGEVVYLEERYCEECFKQLNEI